jgi:transposase-like protein
LAIERSAVLPVIVYSMSALVFPSTSWNIPPISSYLLFVFRLRHKLSLRDLAEMFLVRGWVFTHETVRDWETRFAPLLADQLRAKRRGQAGRSWYVDETYVKVQGKWCYLYRAIDRDGNLVDSRLERETKYGCSKTIFQANA